MQPINVPTHTRYGMDKSIEERMAVLETKHASLKEKIDTGRAVLEEKNRELEESKRIHDEAGREYRRRMQECEELERGLADLYDADVDIAEEMFRLKTTY